MTGYGKEGAFARAALARGESPASTAILLRVQYPNLTMRVAEQLAQEACPYCAPDEKCSTHLDSGETPKVNDLVEDREGDKAIVRETYANGQVGIEWDCRPGQVARVHRSQLTNISELVRELDAS